MSGAKANGDREGVRRSDPEPAQIMEALERILDSPAFQGSRRCQELLRHLVTRKLSADLASLKERMIGAELFGRNLDYDTSSDAIVRVKANEVRRRLAAYYGETGRRDPLRIELPVGSYIPVFRWSAEDGNEAPTSNASASPAGQEGAEPSERRLRFWWRIAAAVAVVAVAAFAVWLALRPPPGPMAQFWLPFEASDEPVLLCIPARDRWFFDPEVQQALKEAAQARTMRLDLSLQPGSVAMVPNGEMSVQNFRAILQLATHLARRRVPTEVRLVSEVSVDAIRRRHVILVGAYHNPWSVELSSGMRYVFESEGQGRLESCRVRDRMSKGEPKWKVPRLWPYAVQTVDYAIISRIFLPGTEQVVVAMAGLNGFGTQVGAEFLTTPAYWKHFARLVQPGWERRNCQIVLETKVVRELPNPPRILAVHVW
jgi:hypothetical protein